jgi:SAM-dependent methyltransferase
MPSGFDRIARPYHWLEYLSFGPLLARCRNHWLPEMQNKRRALVIGDGDGRFTARLLKENPAITVDAVDISRAMLTLLRARSAKAANRLTTHCTDALAFSPTGHYDLLVTHFFLDCLSTSDIHRLAETLRPHLAPEALWVVSDFDIPPAGLSVLPARILIGFLYLAFGLLTGLKTRHLPDYRSALQSASIECKSHKAWLGGFLFSELLIPVNN